MNNSDTANRERRQQSSIFWEGKAAESTDIGHGPVQAQTILSGSTPI